jgi:hypothetical protein
MAESKAVQSSDEDMTRGAVEADPQDASGRKSQESMGGQIGHRDQDPMLKDNDTDFPEPDAQEEHTGEPGS